MVCLKAGKSGRFGRKENIVGWLYCSPIIIGVLLFTLVPIIVSVYTMFIEWSGYNSIMDAQFVAWQNFKDVFTGYYSKNFFTAILNTFWLLISVPITMILGILFAMGMNRKMAGAKVFRVLYYLPSITSVVAVTVLFQKLFTYDGTVNGLMSSIGIPKVKWLTDDTMVKVTINILLVWKGVGYSSLMYLAGLQSVSKDQIEASQIDGANTINRFFKIVLPALYPITFYLLVTGVMNGLQVFNEPFILVKYGTANNAMTGASFVYYYYKESALGVAAVGAWALAILVFIVTAVQVAVDNKKEKY